MKYRKKPVVVEAVRWMGGIESLGEIEKLKGVPFSKDELMDIVKNYEIRICTPEGEMTASLGDYIIRGVHGEIYPCKPDIFEETYEMAGGRSRGTFDEERFGVVEDDEMSVAEEMWRKTRR